MYSVFQSRSQKRTKDRGPEQLETLHLTGFFTKRRVVQLIVLGLFVVVVAVGFSGLGSSAAAVRSAEPLYIALAIGSIGLSYCAAALTYLLLSSKRLYFGPTLLVQIAGGLVNRLLPAGLGGLGLGVVYLKKQGLSLPGSTAIVAANNTLGFVGNLLLLLGAGVLYSFNFSFDAAPDVPSWLYAVVVVLVLALLAYLDTHRRVMRAFVRSAHEASGVIFGLFRRPVRTIGALLSSCIVTLLHALTLFFVLQSLQLDLHLAAALFAVSVGAFAGAAIPTPGGIGGAEAGIAGALVALALPAPVAVTAALIYRGITYWLPLLPGYVALRIVEKRYL
jgi:undecaprenyl-diphosphatase